MELVLHPEISKWRDAKTTNLKLFRDVRQRGLLQNLVARKLPNGDAQLLAGGERYKVLKSLDKSTKEILEMCKVLENISDEEAILIAYNENNLRENMNAIEEARAFKSLAKLKLTHKQIGEKAGQSETYVRDRLHLLELPKDVQKMILEGKVPVSYAPVIRKLSKFPQAQVTLAKKIATNQYDKITTIEKAESVVAEVLQDKKRIDKLRAKYGVCPKCGSPNIDQAETWGDDNKLRCGKCNFVFHGETKDPWQVFKLKRDAKSLGLEATVTNGKVNLKPKQVAEIVAERTEAIAKVEKPNPSFRSGHSVGEFLAPLIADDNIQNLVVDGETVTLKLIKGTNLHFKATRKDYQTGEKSWITVTEGWRDNEKVDSRLPKVKEYEASL